MSIKIGSANVDLTINSARWASSLAEAQTRLSAATRGWKADFTQVKLAAKDVGITTNQLVREFNTLRAELNPAATAAAGYRQQIKLLDQALKLGVISQKEWAASVKTAHVAYQQNISKTASANAQAQAGMQQLSFQLNDIATMWAMGSKPMQIFASQSGQVIQAVQLMTTTTSRFGAFMAGPWGIAVTAGIIVLSALIPKLLETEDAMKDVQFASNAMADAQSILGNVMDLTTGKITTQSKALMGLARAQAIAGQIDARRKIVDARAELQGLTNQYGGSTVDALVGKGVTAGSAAEALAGGKVNRSMLTPSARVATSVLAGWNTDAAVKALDKLRESGKITDKQFLSLGKTISDLGVEGENLKKFELLEKALDGDREAISAFLDPKKPAKGKQKKAPDMATTAEQAEALGRYDMEILRARLDLATTAEDRADLEGQMLDLEKAQRYAEIETDKKLTNAQKAQQRKKLEALYGPQASANGDITVGNGLLYQQQLRRDAEQQARLSADMLARQADSLQAWAVIEPNTRRRAEMEERALVMLQNIERSRLEEQIAAGQVANAVKARADLESKLAAQREQQSLSTMTPMQRYQYNLRADVANINDAMEGVQVDAMEGLNDGIANAIAGTQKLGDVFKQVAQQIIADLIRIQIRKAIVGSLSNALNLFGGGGRTAWEGSINVLGGSGGPLSVAGDNTLSAVPRFAKGTRFAMGGLSMVGEYGPELVDMPRGSQVISNRELAELGGGGGGDTYISYTLPSEEFWGQVDNAASNRANMTMARERKTSVRKGNRKLGRS
ncbi:phage tail tape measure C-terminal domain-containing protein [Novosphingobium gossypii]|uniref:phage tail tape measure C-terminal domain-containing protein n=1 Tax=Novosphingobium gossypii TaxID=1604774 RepID=UPI003D1F8245